MSINIVAVSGNLTRDPELRHTQGGTAVCSMRIAVNERVKDANGDWGDRANYFDVTVWGNQGERCAEWLSKGKKITVAGRLRWREWETQEGGKRQTVEIVADRIDFPPKQQSGSSDGYREDYAPPVDESYAPSNEPDFVPAKGSDDDIPF